MPLIHVPCSFQTLGRYPVNLSFLRNWNVRGPRFTGVPSALESNPEVEKMITKQYSWRLDDPSFSPVSANGRKGPNTSEATKSCTRIAAGFMTVLSGQWLTNRTLRMFDRKTAIFATARPPPSAFHHLDSWYPATKSGWTQ